MARFTEEDFKDPFYKLVHRLQEWRQEDHEDNKVLSRHEIILLLEGIYELCYKSLKP